MCAECGMNPCHPRCPNAPEPVPVHECVKCGYGILAGDKFWDSPEGKICEEWQALESKGFQIMSGLDVIEYTLKAGEKDRIIDAIDTLSGYESNIEEVAKN